MISISPPGRSIARPAVLAAMLAVAVLLAVPRLAEAHEPRDVGRYQFDVGWLEEPAYEGLKNGVSLRITRIEGGTGVEGAAQTLQVEVTHLESGASATFPLRTVFRDPGHYAVDLIPTAAGAYRFRFFGAVEGMTLDETFESGEETFAGVQPSADLQFPEPVPEAREVESAVRGAQETAFAATDDAEAARSRAVDAQTLAIGGIAVGGVALLLGLGALIVALRRR